MKGRIQLFFAALCLVVCVSPAAASEIIFDENVVHVASSMAMLDELGRSKILKVLLFGKELEGSQRSAILNLGSFADNADRIEKVVGFRPLGLISFWLKKDAGFCSLENLQSYNIVFYKSDALRLPTMSSSLQASFGGAFAPGRYGLKKVSCNPAPDALFGFDVHHEQLWTADKARLVPGVYSLRITWNLNEALILSVPQSSDPLQAAFDSVKTGDSYEAASAALGTPGKLLRRTKNEEHRWSFKDFSSITITIDAGKVAGTTSMGDRMSIAGQRVKLVKQGMSLEEVNTHLPPGKVTANTVEDYLFEIGKAGELLLRFKNGKLESKSSGKKLAQP